MSRIVTAREIGMMTTHGVNNSTISDRDYILLLIKENPTITQEELANIMGKSRRSVQMLMKQLIEDDAIERLGSKKRGTWILK